MKGDEENVVLRLRRRLQQVRKAGFKVRLEPLEDQQGGWCVIAGVPTLFIDLSQTAAEQLAQLEDTLESLRAELPGHVQPTRRKPNSGKHAA